MEKWREVVEELESASPRELIELMVNTPLHDLLSLADYLTRTLCGNYVTFTHNIVVNYTNICCVRCPICAFSRSPTDPDAYVLSPEQIAKIVEYAYRNYGVLEVHLNGGLNPELGPEYFETTFRLIKQRAPRIRIKGFIKLRTHFRTRY